MPYAFDDERAPLIRIRLHGRATGGDARQVRADLDALLARRQPFAVVFDCRELAEPDSSALHQLVEWFGSNFDPASRYVHGVAWVTESSAIREVLKSAMQHQRMPTPIQVVGKLDDGDEWAEAKLGSAHRSGLYRSVV